MEVRLLGPVAVVDDDRVLVIRQRRQRALLALLALRSGETVGVDRLVEELWGAEAPKTAVASLQNAVSRLRKLLGVGVLVTREPGYAIDTERTTVDVARFEHLLAEARAARSMQDEQTAADVLREALALWRGPALADLAYEPFAQSEIRRLEELRQTAVEERIDADLARGRHEALVPELEQLVSAEPLREHLHGQLMLALYRSGRQADALAAYRSARGTLVSGLGIEPGPELKQLEQAILRQDASLSLPGTVVVARAPRMQFRRLATILIADAAVVSTSDETLEPETLHRVLGAYAETARSTIARHGGSVDSLSGDTLMATFGAQAADETHALRAARAALELRLAVKTTNERPARTGARVDLSVGIATGEVVVSRIQGREQFVTGDAVRLAAGLQRAAAAGDVVLCPVARRLLDGATVEPLGELELRGRGTPVEAHRLVELADGSGVSPERDAPLVGRARELRMLRATLRDARKAGSTRSALVLGPAGIGKSRLARELVRGTRGFDALVARCPSYGEGLTYLPVRQLVGSDPADVSSALAGRPHAAEHGRRLLAFDGTAADIARAFSAWCEGRAARRPLLLVVDDLHWAEPTFLDLLEHLTESGGGPIALVGLAREELVHERPDVLPRAARIELDGLTLADSETLVDHLLSRAALTADSRGRVFEAAEGNPLFLEQLVALAAEGEPLEADRPLPATVQALLAARLDRLGPGERAVLERAAVVGREFTAEHVTALLDPEATPTAGRHLAALERRGFVRTSRAGGLRFRHVLVQEATYRATPKSLRSGLHERLADALDRQDAAPDALVGFHLEQAYRLRVELGPPDRAAKRIAEDAGRRLGAAGIRAWQRQDAPAAINLFRRATSLLPATDPGRLELLCELGTALKFVGDDAGAEAALLEASSVAAASGGKRLHLRAELERSWPRYRRGDITGDEIVALAERALPTFDAADDDRGLGRCWLLIAAVRSLHGQWAACKEAASKALDHGQRAGFDGDGSISMLAAAAYAGPDPVEEAIGYCEALLARHPSPETGLVLLAHLEAMRCRFDDARRALTRSREFVEERGGVSSSDWVGASAAVEMLADRPASAESILREECTRLEERGDRAWLATLEAALAESLYEQDRFDDALEHAQRARVLAPDDDLSAQTAWRRVVARLSARAGEFSTGERLAREAQEMLERTDSLNDQAQALVDLAEVLYRAGLPVDARTASEAGLGCLARKGNIAGLRRARARLAALDAITPRLQGPEGPCTIA